MGHAAPVAMEVLGLVDDHAVVTRTARFNLEINATPAARGGCFSGASNRVQSCLDRVHAAARPVGAGAILARILPSLKASDLVTDNMTPLPRFACELDRALALQRGEPIQIHIRGSGRAEVHPQSLMVESCNCGFQIHFRRSIRRIFRSPTTRLRRSRAGPRRRRERACSLGPEAVARVADRLVQQSTDTRTMGTERESVARVTFGPPLGRTLDPRDLS